MGFNDLNLEIRMLVVHMHVCYMLSKTFVIFTRRFIQNQEEQIKTREKSSWKIDVLDRRYFGIVSTIKRVGSSKDRGACVQRS